MSPTYQSVLDDLNSLAIKTIAVPFCNDVQNGIAYHADVICHHIGDSNIVLYQYNEQLEQEIRLLGFNIFYSKSKLDIKYPKDIALNAARVGKWLICNKAFTDESILSFTSSKYIIDTSQGYAKCSTLVVDENSVVTADVDIATKAKACGIDVLKIEQGSIKLDGYNYGFIGGCGAKIDKNTMYFTGDIKSHPQGNIISNFINNKGIKIISGSSKELIDIGSIIVLKE